MTELLSILSSALFDRPLSLSISEAQGCALLKEAERQTVTGLAFDMLQRHQVRLRKECVFQYYSQVQKVREQNLRMNKAVAALARLLDKSGLSYSVVKGQVAASFYPKPELRQSGDIDFYCDEDNFQKVKTLLDQSWHVEYKGEEGHHHIEFKRDGVLFEQHTRLIKFYDKRKTDYWDGLMREAHAVVVIDGCQVQTLSPTLHSLYIFLHLYHHLLEIGVGLRQFCDWAMILHRCKGKIDHEAIRQHLAVLGMERAYRACGSVVVDGLNLPADEFSFTLNDKDRRYGKKILDVVAYRGNMGKYNKRGGDSGLWHNIEATAIKCAHFFKFMPLAPSYSCCWIANELKRKISNKLS